MIKVFQDKFGFGNGNCMQAVVASLLELQFNKVPEFLGKSDEYTWWDEYIDFLRNHGYELDTIFDNPRQLGGYGEDRIKEVIEGKHSGIKGDFFYAAVYSPYLFDRVQYICNSKYNAARHAVIVDRKMNIIHDPHPHYQKVKEYPLHEYLGYNGILSIDIFKRKV